VRPAGLCIVGLSETWEVGLCKVIKDTIVKPGIRYLLVCGSDPHGYHLGRALLAVKEGGVDERMRVAGLRGAPVVLDDVSKDEVEAFREHIDVVDMTWTNDAEAIVAKINELSRSCPPRECGGCTVSERPASAPPGSFQCPWIAGLDRAGFFVIRPNAENGTLTVEHYFYDRRLLRRIAGRDKRAIFRAIIDNGWATQSSHVAYLWRELVRAEQALKKGLRYIQDLEPS
jgi:hypothetical protein